LLGRKASLAWGLALEEDGRPVRLRRSDAAVLLEGIAIGLISIWVAYQFSYVGADPENDKECIIVMALILSGIIAAILLIHFGAVAYMPRGLSGQEITGYSEVPRRRRMQ
jgi:hypothetical protein